MLPAWLQSGLSAPKEVSFSNILKQLEGPFPTLVEKKTRTYVSKSKPSGWLPKSLLPEAHAPSPAVQSDSKAGAAGVGFCR